MPQAITLLLAAAMFAYVNRESLVAVASRTKTATTTRLAPSPAKKTLTPAEVVRSCLGVSREIRRRPKLGRLASPASPGTDPREPTPPCRTRSCATAALSPLPPKRRRRLSRAPNRGLRPSARWRRRTTRRIQTSFLAATAPIPNGREVSAAATSAPSSPTTPKGGTLTTRTLFSFVASTRWYSARNCSILSLCICAWVGSPRVERRSHRWISCNAHRRPRDSWGMTTGEERPSLSQIVRSSRPLKSDDTLLRRSRTNKPCFFAWRRHLRLCRKTIITISFAITVLGTEDASTL